MHFCTFAALTTCERLFNKVLLPCTIVLLVPPLTLANIISTHHVYSQSECAFNCLIEDGCVGFKYKSCTNTKCGNCQLSNTTEEGNSTNIEDNGWIFFIDLKNNPVSKIDQNYLVLCFLHISSCTPNFKFFRGII